MMLDEEVLLELESEYEISFSTIMKYYTILKDIPCVTGGSEYNLRECLELLIQDRISNSFIIKEQDNKKDALKVQKSLEYSISSALYEIYEEKSIPYLCDEFIQERDIDEEQIKSRL